MDMETQAHSQELSLLDLTSIEESLMADLKLIDPSPEFKQTLKESLIQSRVFSMRKEIGAIWVLSLGVLLLGVATYSIGSHLCRKSH